MTAVAIVLAAGSGRRFGGKKQFSILACRPVFVHSLSLFQQIPNIKEIICVVPEEDQSYAENIIAEYALTKVKNILPGGAKRQDSVAVALSGLEKEKSPDDLVLVHDGARPFLSTALVNALMQKAEKYGAAVAARPVTDSLKEVSKEGFIRRSIPRDGVWAMQTPQVFRLSLLSAAYKKGLADAMVATDDAMMVERLGHPIFCVEGLVENIKITEASDLKRAAAWIEKQSGE